MTEILLVCQPDGSFKQVSASGHAGFAKKGKDIVCAAITMLLRTSMEVLEKTESVNLKTDMAFRGNLAFSVEAGAGPEIKARLKCTADFIRTGIRSLEEEYPNYVQLREIIED